MVSFKNLAIACLLALPALAQSNSESPPTQEDPDVQYFQSTPKLSCAIAADVNGVIDAGWAPPQSTPPLSPQVMAETVAACLERKGLYKAGSDGRGAVILTDQSESEISAAYCECNEEITSERLWCQTTKGPRSSPLELSSSDVFILTHARSARCVALLIVKHGSEGHVLGVTGGSIDGDGNYSLETRESAIPNNGSQPILNGKIGSPAHQYAAGRYFWSVPKKGAPELRSPESSSTPAEATTLGYILKCPTPNEDTLQVTSDEIIGEL